LEFKGLAENRPPANQSWEYQGPGPPCTKNTLLTDKGGGGSHGMEKRLPWAFPDRRQTHDKHGKLWSTINAENVFNVAANTTKTGGVMTVLGTTGQARPSSFLYAEVIGHGEYP
jgi:hypothetical protein